MKKIYFISVIVALFMTSCNDWLDRDPVDKLKESEAYSSENTINSVIAGLYDRLPDIGAIHQDPGYYTQLDEGISGLYVNNFENFPKDYWSYYDYTLIRDINSHLGNLDATGFLEPDHKNYYIAEARLLRAYVYFELVKRMGGVPLITEIQGFVPGSDPSYYQVARSKESDIYDFIATEIDEIKDYLAPKDIVTQYNRASKGLALAMKARAMLYAGTLAKYNSQMDSPISLPGGEVGIPASKAPEYFRACLAAVKELERMEIYSLYDKNTNKTTNFEEVFSKKQSEGNTELIFIKQFKSPNVLHNWTYNNIPRSMRVGGPNGTGGSTISPVLNLIDAFDMTDGSSGKINPYTDPTHPDEIVDDKSLDSNPDSYKYYTELGDIFNDKDYRLFATIMTPGKKFGSNDLAIQAGIAYFNTTTQKFEFLVGTLDPTSSSNTIVLDGQVVEKTKADGPAKDAFVTSTGFYVKKYMESSPVGPSLASEIQFIRYRYGEALLNAAEAAAELGESGDALYFYKKIRERAGMPVGNSVTLEQIRNERRVELAFEGHRFYDLKRWRIAHELFDGSTITPTAVMCGLWPYKVYRPGDASHNKWIFARRIHPGVITAPRRFVLSNYYSAFSTGALSNNPKLIPNPGH